MVIQYRKYTTDDWDTLIYNFEDYNIYQSFKWGLQKEKQGWHIERVALQDEEKVVGCIQMQIKHLPLGGAIIWVPGGFLGQVHASEVRYYLKMIGIKYFVIRSSFNFFSENTLLFLKKSKWKKASVNINNPMSILLEMHKPMEEIVSEMSSNWRHNLKRSQKKNIKVEQDFEPSGSWLRELYAEMEERKGLGLQFSKSEIDSIVNNFKDDLYFYKATDAENNICAIRGFIKMKDKAWDMFAITTPLGRNNYSSHALMWKCIESLKALNVKIFDLSGIDPESNKGTYNFKKGTGAKEITFLGEWDYSNIPLMRGLFNFYVKIKMKN